MSQLPNQPQGRPDIQEYLRELQARRAEASKANMMQNMLKAGNKLVGGDGSMMDSQIANNNQGVANYESDQKLIQEDQIASAFDDPNSPQSKQAQVVARSRGMEVPENMTANMFQQMLKAGVPKRSDDLLKRQEDRIDTEVGFANSLEKQGLDQSFRASENNKTRDQKAAELKSKGGQQKPLSAEQQKRLDSVKMAHDALKGMDQALASGDNTFSVIGDNDYTLNERMFADALGRLQSGGAINSDEAKSFKAMAPGVMDLKEYQGTKLKMLLKIMEDRAAGLNRPLDEYQQQYGLSGSAGESKPEITEKDLDNMSEEELQEFINAK